jgi:hypothetical protein
LHGSVGRCPSASPRPVGSPSMGWPQRRVRQTAHFSSATAVVYQPDQDAEEAFEGGGNDESESSKRFAPQVPED